MRLAANEAVKTTLDDSKQASLTSEAYENLKADSAMRQDRNRQQESVAPGCLWSFKFRCQVKIAFTMVSTMAVLRLQTTEDPQLQVILPDSTNDMERRAASQQLRSSQRSRQTDARPRGTAKAEPNDKYHVIARCDDMCELLSCLANEGFSEPDENISRKPDFQVSSVRVCEEMGL